MTDRIEKRVEMKAPIARVWRALTDFEEFGQWFRVKLDGPFVVGQASRGHITWPGYEHIKWEAQVVAMEPQHLFAFTWHPYAVDPDVDYSSETPTRVEFRLEPTEAGTRLTVVETGFDALPEHRRPDCLRMNDSGWTTQVENIKAHVGG
jgi:uncharacterized protein YndB with AHSA1/START domain